MDRMNRCGFREVVASALLIMFAWAFYLNPTSGTLQGAIMAAFAVAYGFYLGGSKVGSDTATQNANTVTTQAASNLPSSDVSPPPTEGAA